MRFNNKLPLFVSPVPDPLATAVDALSLSWEDLDAYAFPPAAFLGKVVEKLQDMKENHSDCSRVAQHALVLGPSDHVQSDPTEPAFLAQPVNTALQSDPSQKSDKPKSPSMAPRATAIKEQGFSGAVATRIEAPQRGSTRSVYEAKWTTFTKWCVTNQVDFRASPIKSVADFLMYLFQDRKLQPSTIDGYRSAIADKLGNSPLNISKDENLTRLLDSFHRYRPKGRRGKKGFDKDISPVTISSWIKQTVILCYELSDQEALALHQVKAHDVRAFTASKAFQSGASLEQILSACHWKSHHTFTQFYLKDVAWADSELYHLGPVVAAQQIHQLPWF